VISLQGKQFNLTRASVIRILAQLLLLFFPFIAIAVWFKVASLLHNENGYGKICVIIVAATFWILLIRYCLIAVSSVRITEGWIISELAWCRCSVQLADISRIEIRGPLLFVVRKVRWDSEVRLVSGSKTVRLIPGVHIDVSSLLGLQAPFSEEQIRTQIVDFCKTTC